MQILTKRKCESCEGAGLVDNGIWQELFGLENKSGKAWEWHEVEKWFNERGYNKIPDEEIPCHECEGVGEIQEWMDIQKVLELANVVG